MKHTFADAARIYLTRPGGMGRTTRVIAAQLEHDLRSVPLAKVDQVFVDGWVSRRHAGNAPGTVRRELVVMQSILNTAAKRGMCPPLRLDKPRVDDARVRVLTDLEEAVLLPELPPEVRSLVMFLLHTGCRLGEALALTWADVTPNGATFSTRKGGRKRMRTVPLNATALMALGQPGVGRVFRNALGQPWAGRSGVQRHFAAACHKAGVLDMRMHDLRHTFASRLVSKGVGLRVVADLLGHATMEMTMRYSHLAPSTLAASVSLLG